MLSLAGYNFYLYTHNTDMRMGINGLSGIVRNIMDQDPLNRGVIYLFFNGRRTQVKMLVFEGDGHALYHKRLAQGTFGTPVYDQATRSVTLDKKDVMLILEGVEIRYRKRYERKKSGIIKPL
jgi:transposase